MFSNQDFEDFAVSKGRDYHLVFFLNANYLAGNAKMNLPKLRQEFALAAKVMVTSQSAAAESDVHKLTIKKIQ